MLMYTSTGLQKVSTHWIPFGDLGALYYIMQQPSWVRVEIPGLASVYPLTQLATLATWVFEVFFGPLLLITLWGRSSREQAGPLRRLLIRWRFRDLFAVSGALMHLGIFVLMQVGPFSIVSLSMYPALWHADEVRRWRLLRQLKRLLRND